MSGASHDARAARASLDHPVIDSDGHWIESFPSLLAFTRKHKMNKALDVFENFVAERVRNATATPPERRKDGRVQGAWWILPTSNGNDRATAMIPQLLHERMEELGLDFTVLYPTYCLPFTYLANAEAAQAACRAFNIYTREHFAGLEDRMTAPALIPMATPEAACEELDYAVRELGLKSVVLGSLVKRPGGAAGTWLDVLGLDSEHNYDSVWAKCVELKVAPTFHTVSSDLGLRRSTSNYVYNHIGHFGAAGESVCKALFMGGVTRRFPTLKFAFQEGGASWACQLYADLIGHWKKRTPNAVKDFAPSRLDGAQLAQAFQKHFGAEKAAEFGEGRFMPALEQAWAARESWSDEALDDFARCGITKGRDVKELFEKHFYFGCEADDRMNAWGFNTAVNPYGARLRMLLGSDIGHFDVTDMRDVLPEAIEMVEYKLITQANLRQFLFETPVEFWAGTNPDFFKGTAIENQVAQELKAQQEAATAAPKWPMWL